MCLQQEVTLPSESLGVTYAVLPSHTFKNLALIMYTSLPTVCLRVSKRLLMARFRTYSSNVSGGLHKIHYYSMWQTSNRIIKTTFYDSKATQYVQCSRKKYEKQSGKKNSGRPPPPRQGTIPRVSKEVARGPQQSDTCPFHQVRCQIHQLVQVSVGLGECLPLRCQVTVMEGPVLDT